MGAAASEEACQNHSEVCNTVLRRAEVEFWGSNPHLSNVYLAV